MVNGDVWFSRRVAGAWSWVLEGVIEGISLLIGQVWKDGFGGCGEGYGGAHGE